MEIKSFLNNLAKFAATSGLLNNPILEITKKDMKELKSYLEDNHVKHSVVHEQELTFEYANVNFIAIENDKGEETGADGKLLAPQKWEKVLSDEEQEYVDKNKTAKEQGVSPMDLEPPSESKVMKDHISGSTLEAANKVSEETVEDKKKHNGKK